MKKKWVVEDKKRQETAVIIKFIRWYEALDPLERTIFEGCLGRIVQAVKLDN